MRGNQSTFQTNALFLFAHQDDEVGIFQKILDEQRLGRRIERWSQDFGPFVKVDYLTRKTVLHDKEKESFSRV